MPGSVGFLKVWGEVVLRRFSVRRHQPEIVFGVLVVILRRHGVPRPGLFLGKLKISLVASLGALTPVQLGAGCTRCPPLWASRKGPCRFGLARAHDCLWPIFCMAPSLITADEICSRRSTKDQNLVQWAPPLLVADAARRLARENDHDFWNELVQSAPANYTR